MSAQGNFKSQVPGSNPRRRRAARHVPVGGIITCPAQIASGGVIRVRSERAADVARMFGLGRRRQSSASATGDAQDAAKVPRVELRPGTITLLTGASGAGKSTLLRAVVSSPQHRGRAIIDLVTLATPADVPVVDCFDGLPLRGSLERLARVGLGEAWTYLRTPAELSEGQRWRFRLAVALHRATDRSHASTTRPLIVCDEFAAVLDRVTACVVAHRLRRAIDGAPHVAAVVATSHDDLAAALAADVTIHCDFGRHEVVDRPRMK